MEMRQLKQADFYKSMALSSFAFQYELPADLSDIEAGFKPEHTWGFFEDQELAAKMSILPFEIYIQGKLIPMGGIAGVATWPEYRRQGLVAQLIRHGLQVMKDAGQSISLLHPFEFGFYRKFGWETYIEYKKYTIGKEFLVLDKRTHEGTVVRCEKDSTKLNDVYERYASRYNGTLKRTEERWENTVFKRKESQIALYIREDGSTAGYLIYEVKNREMKIQEFVSLDHKVNKAMWAFISNHDSMIDSVTVELPSNDRLPFTMNNPRIKQEIIPYFMARIVDVATFLEQYSFASTGSVEQLNLQITDTEAVWNNGTTIVNGMKTGRLR